MKLVLSAPPTVVAIALLRRIRPGCNLSLKRRPASWHLWSVIGDPPERLAIQPTPIPPPHIADGVVDTRSRGTLELVFWPNDQGAIRIEALIVWTIIQIGSASGPDGLQ
jgi:hypothetical protein